MLNVIGATNYNKQIKVGDKIEAGTAFQQLSKGIWYTNTLKNTGIVTYVSSVLIQVLSEK